VDARHSESDARCPGRRRRDGPAKRQDQDRLEVRTNGEVSDDGVRVKIVRSSSFRIACTHVFGQVG
jgi:hypothetical protein